VADRHEAPALPSTACKQATVPVQSGCAAGSFDASRSKASTDLALSNAWFVGSNPIRGTDVSVCLFCVCVALCVGSGLA
jgi:hypothetical protein